MDSAELALMAGVVVLLILLTYVVHRYMANNSNSGGDPHTTPVPGPLSTWPPLPDSGRTYAFDEFVSDVLQTMPVGHAELNVAAMEGRGEAVDIVIKRPSEDYFTVHTGSARGDLSSGESVHAGSDLAAWMLQQALKLTSMSITVGWDIYKIAAPTHIVPFPPPSPTPTPTPVPMPITPLPVPITPLPAPPIPIKPIAQVSPHDAVVTMVKTQKLHGKVRMVATDYNNQVIVLEIVRTNPSRWEIVTSSGKALEASLTWEKLADRLATMVKGYKRILIYLQGNSQPASLLLRALTPLVPPPPPTPLHPPPPAPVATVKTIQFSALMTYVSVQMQVGASVRIKAVNDRGANYDGMLARTTNSTFTATWKGTSKPQTFVSVAALSADLLEVVQRSQAVYVYEKGPDGIPVRVLSPPINTIKVNVMTLTELMEALEEMDSGKRMDMRVHDPHNTKVISSGSITETTARTYEYQYKAHTGGLSSPVETSAANFVGWVKRALLDKGYPVSVLSYGWRPVVAN